MLLIVLCGLEPVWRILYDSAKLSKWKQIREDVSYNLNPTLVPSLFGDICLAYQGHLMSKFNHTCTKNIVNIIILLIILIDRHAELLCEYWY